MRIVECLGYYLARNETPISRAQAEQRMFAKLTAPRFIGDVRPLLAPEEAEKLTDDAIKRAFTSVLDQLIVKMPGEPWANTAAKREQFGV